MEMVFIYCLLCVCSGSLVQSTPARPTTSVFNEILKIIRGLEEGLQKDAEKLHTPRNIPERCMPSAFRCFINETLFLKPAVGHRELFHKNISRLKNFQCPGVSEQTCSSCASYRKQSPQTFLKDFRLLLQRANQLLLNPRRTDISEQWLLECPST